MVHDKIAARQGRETPRRELFVSISVCISIVFFFLFCVIHVYGVADNEVLLSRPF
jgi:hypothetical protein